ncbi:hypothetical protein Pla123a_37030 [Posidoniimonas polymericola]|uniref:Uncharacterized protein n=1 Tax=Posidoniimonas polymericola TaxID=2528002 RepID=A0A5C5YFR8_9BACT|nr:hypothetical protein [Posidoniimonas polymericola]TWT73809.1 hypothetical protein Pla123a_37030 [Posidoniimonas polymericola]
MQFSLKEFLLLVGFASAGMASLLYASPAVGAVWQLLVAALVFAAAARAWLLPGPRRVYAVGFLAVAVAYTAVLYSYGNEVSNGYRSNYEYNPGGGKMPTNKLMQQPHTWVAASRSYFVDIDGKRYPQVPPGHTIGDIYNNSTGQKLVAYHVLPEAESFMTVAHCLWTLLLGYVGGKYAVWVYTRNKNTAPE